MTDEADFWQIFASHALGNISDSDFADFLEDRWGDDQAARILIDRLRSRTSGGGVMSTDEFNPPGWLSEVTKSIIGCQWGTDIGLPDNNEPCSNVAVQIVVLHQGDVEAPFKLCAEHRDIVLEQTDPHS